MPQTVKGVIARSKGAPVELVDVVVPDPGPGEAVVVVQACGVVFGELIGFFRIGERERGALELAAPESLIRGDAAAGRIDPEERLADSDHAAEIASDENDSTAGKG